MIKVKEDEITIEVLGRFCQANLVAEMMIWQVRLQAYRP